MDDGKRRLRRTAAAQDGQFATPQAASLGVGRHAVAGMRRAGEIEQRRLAVWRFTSAPGTPDPAVTAALACWPAGVISHASAALYHGLRRIQPPQLAEVTVPHGEVRRLPGIRVHWSRALPDCDILVVGGMRYTTLARTVCDLADDTNAWETLSLVDDAIATGARRSWLHARAKALTNGRGGVRLVRDATARDAAGEFRSWLERAAAHLYRAGGLPDPQWNVPVRDKAGLIGVVDALWLPWRVVAEKEGLRFHTPPAQRRRDAHRFNRLQEAHFAVRRFTWEDIVHRPLVVVDTLHRALRAAGADLDPARIPRGIELPRRPFL